MMKPLTKFTKQLVSANNVAPAVREGMTPRPPARPPPPPSPRAHLPARPPSVESPTFPPAFRRITRHAAFRLASEERPGAVHIELPEDIAADDASTLMPFEPIVKRRPIAEGKGASLDASTQHALVVSNVACK